MTILIPGTAGTALQGGRGDTPDATADQSGSQWWIPPWKPASFQCFIEEPDILFLPNASDEQTILAEGGQLAPAWTTYLSPTTVKAPLVAGPNALKAGAFGETADGTTLARYPLDGAFPRDEFTIELPIKSKGADLTAQPSETVGLLAIFDAAVGGGAGDSLRLWREGTAGINCRFYIEAAQYTAGMSLSSGDVPADTWKVISITFKAGVLKVMLGDNVRSGTASSVPTPAAWTGHGANTTAGIFIGGIGPFDIAPPRISREARTYNTTESAIGPTITVDCDTDAGDFPEKLGGLFAQYAYWLANGLDLDSSIRNQLIDQQCAAGLETARIDHVFDKVTTTGSGATPSVSSWANLDEQMDALYAGGIIHFHVTLGYCPTALGGTSNANEVPNNNTGFAKLCSDTVAHMTARYPLADFTWSLWNEPELDNFFLGSYAQYEAMWDAAQAKMFTDHGVLLGTPDGGTTAEFFYPLIDHAVAVGKPLGCVVFHGYNDAILVAREAKTVKDYLVAKGGSYATAPIGVTEWNQVELPNLHTGDASLSKVHRWGRTEFGAANAFATLAGLLEVGATLGTFTRMGIIDDRVPTGSERELGLFTRDDPPRPLPVYAGFQAWWKLQGTRLTATSNFDFRLRCVAAVDDDGRIALAYGHYRLWRPKDLLPIAFDWSNLPVEFTWKQWRYDHRDNADGRLVLIASGNQTNLPRSTKLGALGVGCVEVTPT